jgi:hypothetical protein
MTIKNEDLENITIQNVRKIQKITLCNIILIPG